jgi:hypothetical protein
LHQPSVEVGGLTVDEITDMRTRHAAGPLDRDDLPDLLEREAEPTRTCNEGEQGKTVV